MGRGKLVELAELVSELTGDNEPTDEELGDDENLIEIYDELHNLKICLENAGFYNS